MKNYERFFSKFGKQILLLEKEKEPPRSLSFKGFPKSPDPNGDPRWYSIPELRPDDFRLLTPSYSSFKSREKDSRCRFWHVCKAANGFDLNPFFFPFIFSPNQMPRENIFWRKLRITRISRLNKPRLFHISQKQKKIYVFF